jgi:chromosome segregation ATPase
LQKERSNCAALQAELAASISKFTDQDKARLEELEESRIASEELIERHNAETAELKAELEGAQGDLVQAKTVIHALKRMKREAKERIALLEATQIKSVQVLKEKSELIRADFERTLSGSRDQIEDLRLHLSQAEARSHDLEQQNEQLSADIRDSLIRQKSLDLKVRALEERSEREQKTQAIHSSAKLEQLQKECDAKLQKIQACELESIRKFVEFVNREYRCAFTPSPLDAFLSSLCKYFGESYERETVYADTIGDLVRTRQILGISSSAPISAPIEHLFDERNRLRTDVRQLESGVRAEREKTEQISKTLARFEDDVAALRQWEAWAKRLHRIVHSTVCVTVSSEQLRMSLEETLLGAVSHRSLLNRLTSLRYQKKLLVAVDREALVRRGELRPSLFALVAICMAGLRMQRIAGCIKMEPSEGHSVRRSSRMVRQNGRAAERPS